MSGHLRRVLGPRVAALRKQLDNVPEYETLYDRNNQQATMRDQLKSVKYEINVHVNKLKTSVDYIREKDMEWAMILSSFEDDEELAAEEVLYTATAIEGYVPLLEEADDKLALLVTKELEASELLNEILKESVALSSGSSNTAVSRVSYAAAANLETTRPHMKLPTTELPRFNGDVLKWPNFWQLFKVMVDNQPIEDVEKFGYLQRTLTGKAAYAIAGLEMTPDCYKNAVDILKKRFGNEDVIRDALYGQLRELPRASNQLIDLRVLIDSIDRILRQLKSLGEDFDVGGSRALIVRILQEKLPPMILEKLAESDRTEPWTVNDLRNAIWKIIERKEQVKRLMPTYEKKGNNQNKQKVETDETVQQPRSDAFAVATRTNGQNKQMNNKSPFCLFCNANHYSDECTKYKTLMDRRRRFAELKRCFICTRPNHNSNNCQSRKFPCIHCKQLTHYRALCPSKFGTTKKVAIQKGRNSKSSAQAVVSASDNEECDEHDNEGQEGEDQASEVDEQTISNSLVETEDSVTAAQMESKHKSCGVLMTATTNVVSGTRILEANVFFDQGSQRSFISDSLKKRLKLKSERKETLNVYTFGTDKSMPMHTERVQFEILLKNGSKMKIDANSVQRIAQKQTKPNLTSADMKFIAGILKENMADGNITETTIHPDILIGADYFWDFMIPKKPTKLPSGLLLVPTKLGFMLSGSNRAQDGSPVSSCCVFRVATDEHPVTVHTAENNPTKENFENLWRLDLIGITDDPKRTDDDVALEQFNKSIRVKENGQPEVGWPWVTENPSLPSNFGLVYGRFKTLAKKLSENSEMREEYSKIMNDQINHGMIEVAPNEPQGLVHYLPHHCVVKTESETSKYRIVFDGSAKQSKFDNSLNEILHRGPINLPQVVSLLMNFRLHHYGVVADIEKAFLKLSLRPEDRDCCRFLWFKDPSKPWDVDENLQIMRFAVVPFGISSSPFLLEATLHYLLEKENNEIASKIKSSLYVDNVISGTQTELEAIEFYEYSKPLMARWQMNLRQFTSNSEKLRNILPESDRIKTEEPKVLGIPWNVKEDVLKMNAPTVKVNEHEIMTKRTVLSVIASVYDPLGFASPLLLQAKLLLQKLFEDKYDWDDPISKELSDRWSAIEKELTKISQMYIHRHIECDSSTKFELHAFVDASGMGYATAVYLRTIKGEIIGCHLILAKNRVAPKKKLTIPRLELLALYIGSISLDFCKKQLKLPSPLLDMYLWSDSQVVISWMKTPKPLSTWVNNRVKRIKELGAKIRYVPTDENPADHATRALKVGQLINHDHPWWRGPSFLKLPNSEWPDKWRQFDFSPDEVQMVNSEVKGSGGVIEFCNAPTVTETENGYIAGLFQFDRVSSLFKMQKVACFVLRFLKVRVLSKLSSVNAAKLHYTNELIKNVSTSGPLTSDDFTSAETLLDRQSQLEALSECIDALHKNAKNELVHQLRLYENEKGLLCCRGRLQLADGADSPVLLPRNHPYTKMIIMFAHRKVFHSGVQQTLITVRERYWLVCGKVQVKMIIRPCTICKRIGGGPYRLPEMPQLPVERVHQEPPFANTAIDYFGPITVKCEEGMKKVWVCLFTCLIVRAVHLELVPDFSATSFINALRRFIARRGFPKLILSDNGSQMMLAKKLLESEHINLPDEDPEFLMYCARNRIKWHCITPLSPFKGGVYERMVAICKKSLKGALGRKLLSFEQLRTILTEVEAVVNTRPITFVYSDSDSFQVLRPSDFLAPHRDNGPPLFEENMEPEYCEFQSNTQQLTERWKKNALMLDKLWALWQTEYLAMLRERSQNDHKQKKVLATHMPRVNDIVLIHEDNMPRGAWRVGRIKELIHSADGLIRSAIVQLPKGKLLTRSICLLYPFETKPLKENEEAESKTKTDQIETENSQIMRRSKRTVKKPKRFLQMLCNESHLLLTLLCFSLIKVAHAQAPGECPTDVTQWRRISSEKCVHTGIVIHKHKTMIII